MEIEKETWYWVKATEDEEWWPVYVEKSLRFRVGDVWFKSYELKDLYAVEKSVLPEV